MAERVFTGDPTRGTITPRHPMDRSRVFTFREAADYVMPITVYKGMRLDDIARTDKGLLYLAAFYQIRKDQAEGITFGLSANVRETNAALHYYLTDATIARELNAAREKKERR